MKKLLLFVAVVAMSCTSTKTEETTVNADSVAVIGNIDSCAVVCDSIVVDSL